MIPAAKFRIKPGGEVLTNADFGEVPNRSTRVRYFHGGDEIGEELFVGYALDGDLAYCRRELRRGNYQAEDVYSRLWEQGGLWAERERRMKGE